VSLWNLLAVMFTLAAVFSFLNLRYIGLPRTIGVMLVALVISLLLATAGHFSPDLREEAKTILAGIDFETTVMAGLLSFLLFAGSLRVDVNDLLEQKWAVALLSTVGVVLSAALLGTIAFAAFSAAGLGVSYLECLMLGAIVSPTDPVAVLGLLEAMRAPKALRTTIVGESLFNDGVGAVLFLTLLGLSLEPDQAGLGPAILLFFREAVGGVVFGLLAGLIAYAVLRSVDDYQVEILLTLALVTGGYALATALHVSGLLATVVAGLFIGNQGRFFAMSDRTRERLDAFWEILDEILNIVLFTMIGLEVLAVPFTLRVFLSAVVLIPGALLARYLSVRAALLPLSRDAGTDRLLTWGGLRGAISIALALSVPTPSRTTLLGATYAIVVFSLVVQGSTLGAVTARLVHADGPEETLPPTAPSATGSSAAPQAGT
jgi:CPA1 family monovalent cation:H+ antiporter